jgi:hypothetical protein
MRTDTRLSRLEARRLPPRRLVTCLCAKRNGRRNLPDGEHLGDCPASTADRRDVVLTVRYDSPRP